MLRAASTNPHSFALATPVFNSHISSLAITQTNGFNGHTGQPPLSFGARPLPPESPEVQPTVPSPEPDLFLASMAFDVSTSPPSSFSVNDEDHRTQPIDINAEFNMLPLPSRGPSPQEPPSNSNLSSVLPTSIPCDRSSQPPPLDTDIATPPIQPPPLNRLQPISLPPTPTATVFIPHSTPSKKATSFFGSLKSLQTSSLVQTPTEILSPLVIPSPSTSRFFQSVPHLLRRDSQSSPLRAAVSKTSDDKLKEPTLPHPDQVRRADPLLEATALNFSRKSLLVKTCFSRWRERLSDRAKWLEACRRSQAYSEKVQAERLSRVSATPPLEKKRKTGPAEPRTHPKSRAKSRPSIECRPPPIDEELARRFEKVSKMVCIVH